MFQRSRKGYVEEQMEGIARVMAKILGFKDAGDIPAAVTEIGEFFNQQCGVSLKLVVALSEDSLPHVFGGTTSLDVARRYTAAVLLDEYAQLLTEQNMIAGARASRIRAALLLDSAMKAEETLRTPDNQNRLERLQVLAGV